MEELRAEKSPGYTHALYRDGIRVERYQLNKAEARRKAAEIKAGQTPNETLTVTTTGRIRRIELASRCAGLTTGRAWIADGWTIDRHSLPPEWEGALVCYVYEN